MNKTPEQLEAENDDVRARMDSTLDELEHRLDAREVLRAGLERVRDLNAVRYATAGAVIAGRTAREHPMSAALAGVGLLGLLIWGLRSRPHMSYRSKTYDASNAIGTAKAHLHNARRMLAESTGGTRSRMVRAGSRTMGQLEDAGRSARTALKQHPVAAGSIGLAILAIAAAAAIPAVRDKIFSD